MLRGSTLLFIREMQVKITMRYHFEHFKIAIIFVKKMSVDKVVEKLEPLNTIEGIVNDSHYVKQFRVSSKILKIRTTI